MRKPAPLRPGDVIGVVSPAGATDVGAGNGGGQGLERAGERGGLGGVVFRAPGFLAGEDADRAADLAAMFADAEVRAILAARGGYGSGRLLPVFDVRLAREHPKIFVGYSDLTFLLT